MSSNSLSTSIQTKVMKSGERIFYSLVKKQSQRQLSFNIRLLILVEQKYIGYIRESDFNKKDVQNSIDLNKMKKKVPLKDIRRIMNINKTVSITINDVDKSNKQISLKWIFEMETVKLAENWTQILQKQSSPFPSRKTTEHKEKDNQYSNQKPQNRNPSIKQFAKPQTRQNHLSQPDLSLSKQPEKPKQKQVQKISDQKVIEANNPKPMIIKEDIVAQPKQSNKFLAVKKPQQNKRESELTFSFKGYQQPNPSDDQQNFSPPKRQQKIQLPHPVLEKLKTMESNLSTHLQQKIDLKLVQIELSEHKQNKIQKTPTITNSQSRKQFMQLSSTFTNRQKQIEQSNFNNYFRQPMGEINQQKYIDFYCFCQLKIQELVSLDLKQYKIDDWINYVRSKNGISIEILKTEIKQIPGNNNICDEQLLKMYLNRQKNSNYIWKIISNNQHLSEVFVLPMTCIAEYQGVTIYFQCTFSNQSQIFQEKSKDYSDYFDLLSQLTSINKSVMSNSSCIRFTKLNNKFVINEINQFLPRLISNNRLIRAETFIRVTPQFAPSQKGYQAKNNKKEEEQQNRYFKGSIENSIQEISKNLDRLEQYVLHPSQFGPLMHLYGLNIVHMAEIYRNVQNSFIKSIITTEAAVRSFKAIYRKKMQQSLLQLTESKQQTQSSKVDQQSHKIAKSLLNILLSKRDLSVKLWKMVTLHSQINFKLAIDKSEINKGYLFLGLGHHLGLRFDTVYSSCDKIFTVQNFINAVQFVTKIKPSQLYWINQNIYSMPVYQAAQTLLGSLNIKNRQIPYYVHQDRNMSDKIYEIISLCYAPNSAQIKHIPVYREATECSEQTLHYFRRRVAQIKWQIKKQSELTLSLPAQSLANVKQKIQKIKQQLIYYFGNYHPFYSQFYDLLLSLSEQSHDYTQMQQYSRLSMANMIQLCGGNTMHIKLANNYYQKGDMYANWGKVAQSIDSYKKAKNILQFNQFVKNKQYALVQLKLGELYLSKSKDTQCWKMLLRCFDIFCNIVAIPIQQQPTHPHKLAKNQTQSNTGELESMSSQQQAQIYTNLIKCLELMNRCTGSIPDKSMTLLQHSLLVIENWLEPAHSLQPLDISDTQFVQLLKLFTQSYFNHMAKQISQQFFSYVERLCDQNHHIGSGNSQYSMRKGDLNSAITFIKQLIINAMLIQVIDGFSNKAKMRMEQIASIKNSGGSRANSQLKDKANTKDLERFEQLMRALIVAVGESFMLGILNDQQI